jgi:hypothetical protein
MTKTKHTSNDRPKHTKKSMQNLSKLPATNFVTGTTTDNWVANIPFQKILMTKFEGKLISKKP